MRMAVCRVRLTHTVGQVLHTAMACKPPDVGPIGSGFSEYLSVHIVVGEGCCTGHGLWGWEPPQPKCDTMWHSGILSLPRRQSVLTGLAKAWC